MTFDTEQKGVEFSAYQTIPGLPEPVLSKSQSTQKEHEFAGTSGTPQNPIYVDLDTSAEIPNAGKGDDFFEN